MSYLRIFFIVLLIIINFIDVTVSQSSSSCTDVALSCRTVKKRHFLCDHNYYQKQCCKSCRELLAPISNLPPLPQTTTQPTSVNPTQNEPSSSNPIPGCGRRLSSQTFFQKGSIPFSNKQGISDDKIRGGQEADKNSWPWMALLGKIQNNGIDWLCGGSLINTNWILTAAHCLEASLNIVRLGEHNTAKKEHTEVDFRIDSYQWYPGYIAKRNDHDIGLVKIVIETPLAFAPVCLPWGDEYQRDHRGEKVIVTGWGAINYTIFRSNVLREVSLEIFDTQDCINSYSRHKEDYLANWPQGIRKETTICAGDRLFESDACKGDSGGPLMVGDHEKFTLLGVVSSGIRCGTTLKYPGVYISLLHKPYLDWIRDVAINDSCLESQFKCKNSQKCILDGWICDNEEDCDDASDEDPKLCPAEHNKTTTIQPPVSVQPCGKTEETLLSYNCQGNRISTRICEWMDRTFGLCNNVLSNFTMSCCETCLVIKPPTTGEPDLVLPPTSIDIPNNILNLHCGWRSGLIEHKIAGGQEATKHSWSWMASIGRIENGTYTWNCGGSLINGFWVLTSANCLVTDNNVVRLGAHNLESEERLSREYSIESRQWYPGYKVSGYGNDIALLKLNTQDPAPFTPVCLPWNKDFQRGHTGKYGVITGWGAVGFGGKVSPALKEAAVQIVDFDKCIQKYSHLFNTDQFTITKENAFCASDRGGNDACQGDSGGPFVVGKGEQYTILGIISLGYGCGNPNFAGIYTSVFYPPHLKWIRDVAFQQ